MTTPSLRRRRAPGPLRGIAAERRDTAEDGVPEMMGEDTNHAHVDPQGRKVCAPPPEECARQVTGDDCRQDAVAPPIVASIRRSQ